MKKTSPVLVIVTHLLFQVMSSHVFDSDSFAIHYQGPNKSLPYIVYPPPYTKNHRAGSFRNILNVGVTKFCHNFNSKIPFRAQIFPTSAREIWCGELLKFWHGPFLSFSRTHLSHFRRRLFWWLFSYFVGLRPRFTNRKRFSGHITTKQQYLFVEQ